MKSDLCDDVPSFRRGTPRPSPHGTGIFLYSLVKGQLLGRIVGWVLCKGRVLKAKGLPPKTLQYVGLGYMRDDGGVG